MRIGDLYTYEHCDKQIAILGTVWRLFSGHTGEDLYELEAVDDTNFTWAGTEEELVKHFKRHNT
jgi:hypothetical protein